MAMCPAVKRPMASCTMTLQNDHVPYGRVPDGHALRFGFLIFALQRLQLHVAVDATIRIDNATVIGVMNIDATPRRSTAERICKKDPQNESAMLLLEQMSTVEDHF